MAADATAMQVVIRMETSGDIEAVDAVVADAFGGRRVPDLVASLRASWCFDEALSLVAERDCQVVGHVLFTHAILDAPRSCVDVLVLSPLSVRRECQSRGIGSALVREGLSRVASRAEPLVFLEGSPAFYPRFGFRRAVALGFVKPSVRIPDPAFMVHVTAHHQSWMTGQLVYPDPFWRHDCVGLR